MNEPATIAGDPPLEARWDAPEAARLVVVLCHPHPRHGGTMTAPLLSRLTVDLVTAGAAVLRFNFRGVGRSGGAWSGGRGEIDDVGRAVAAARAAWPGLPVGLAGWSFGAAAALAWQAETGDASAYAGIAPPVRGPLTPPLPAPGRLAPARRTLIVGDRDRFIAMADLRAYAESIDAGFHVLAGSDHFFHFREERLAALILESLTGS